MSQAFRQVVSVPVMPHKIYGKSELFDLLGSNGWSGHALEYGAAIIGAESGGNPLARHVNADGSTDRGIFQINNKAHPTVSDACAYNPRCAARAAWKISKGGTDWSPWNSSKSIWGSRVGDPGSVSAASGVTNAGIPTLGIPNPLKAAEAFFNLLTSLEFWLRLGEGIAGLILIAMGLRSLGAPVPNVPRVVPVP